MLNSTITTKYKIITIMFHTHEVEGSQLYTWEEANQKIVELYNLTKLSGCNRFIDYRIEEYQEKKKTILDRLLTFFC